MRRRSKDHMRLGARSALCMIALALFAAGNSANAAPSARATPPPVFVRGNFNRIAFLDVIKAKTPPSMKELKRFYVRPSGPPPAREQEFTNRKDLIELGRYLFFDNRLARMSKMSCATCHLPEKHWVDGSPFSSEGFGRRTMCLYNLAWDYKWAWSGRATSLSSQAALAMGAPKGMGWSETWAAARVKAIKGYKPLFEKAFGKLPDGRDIRSVFTVLVAIDYFVRSLVSAEAPFDRWIEGDEKAISEEAKKGFYLFNTKARCARCHNSWRFSDGEIYDVGLIPAELYGPNGDHIVLNTQTKAVGLREIAERSPYTSGGKYKTLEQIVAFYNRGGDYKRTGTSSDIGELGLTPKEQTAIIAFLKTLSSGPNTFKAPTEFPK